jgi:hypothetical protein
MPRITETLLAQALIQLRYGLQRYGIGVCFIAPNAESKEKKEVNEGTTN